MVSDAIERLKQLKAERNAIILAHNYQIDEVQDIGDFVGDSLELSRKAAAVGDAEVIVFCGVHFMAETAAILSPEKTVLLPDAGAGCPMADMADGEELRKLKRQHPDAAVVCYVNSTASVKAESDCCCTSANAVEVLKTFPEDQEIIFVPDRHLGDYAGELAGRKLILWPGYCPTHVRILPEDIEDRRREFPNAIVMTHPECPRAVREAADAVLSTGGMLRFVRESSAKEFVVATEKGMIHRLATDFPDKVFHGITERAVCPNMKKITLAKVIRSLETLSPVIRVEEPIRSQALQAINRMLAVG